jgi:hypothetical protein
MDSLLACPVDSLLACPVVQKRKSKMPPSDFQLRWSSRLQKKGTGALAVAARQVCVSHYAVGACMGR